MTLAGGFGQDDPVSLRWDNGWKGWTFSVCGATQLADGLEPHCAGRRSVRKVTEYRSRSPGAMLCCQLSRAGPSRR